jgi:hypothetical protein
MNRKLGSNRFRRLVGAKSMRKRRLLFEALEDRRLLAADAYEPNDNVATVAATLPGWAYSPNLGVLNGNYTFSNLTEEQDDWYRFQTTGTGGAADKVRIDFINTKSNPGDQDLDLELWNGSGATLIASSLSSTQDFEQISLSGRAAGAYYIHVFGKGGVQNPSYTMSVTAPKIAEVTVSDDGLPIFTPRSETFDFGAGVQGQPGPIHTFRVANEGGANLTTSSLVVPAGFKLIGSLASTITPGSFDTFQIQLDTTSVGTQFGHVTFTTSDSDEGSINFAIEGTVTPTTETTSGDVFEENDDFATVAAATPGDPTSPNFGIVTNSRLIQHLVLDDAADWYSFQTTTLGTSHDLARIDFDTTQGNLDLELYDSNQNLLASSNSTDLNFEIVTMQNRPAGTYFIKVVGAGGATNADYDLTLAAPGNGDDDPDDDYEPNDTRQQTLMQPSGGLNSPNLGTLTAPTTLSTLKLEDAGDWFRFNTVAIGTMAHYLSIDFDHLQGDLNLELYDASGFRLDFSNSVSGDTEQISLYQLPAGTYYAHIYGPNVTANANYSLTINPPTLDRNLSLDIAPPVNLFESDATTGTVTRSGDTSFELFVKLHSSDITEAKVPDYIVIPAGWSEASFNISTVNDNVFDQGKSVNITAWVDGYAGANASVSVIQDIVPPDVTNFGGNLAFIENGPAQVLCNGVTVTDDSPDFAFGSINVRFVSGGEVGDQLIIAAIGPVTTQGTDVLDNGTVVGAFEGGVDGVPLAVNFNNQATPATAQDILRAVTYINTSDDPSPTTRVVGTQVADGDGGLSTLVTKQITMTPLNDAPMLNASLNPKLYHIPEDSTGPAGTPVNYLLTGAVTDPDRNALRGIAIVASDTTNGVWQYTFDGGSTWVNVGSVSDTSARLVPGWGKLRFIPAPDFNGNAQISYRAWDQTAGAPGNKLDLTGKLGGTNAYSTNVAAATQVVTPVNDAPVLDASKNPTLGTIWEDATSPVGTTVASLVTGAISDVDAGALQGIAVVAATQGVGTWQFVLSGSTVWQNMGTVYETSALLLVANAGTKVRFIPKANFNGSVSLTFRAWDRTQGAAGNKLDIYGKNGGTTAFSVAKDTAPLTILSVNDKPVLTLSGSIQYVHNAPPITLAANATVTDVDNANFGGGQLHVWISSVISTTNRLFINGGFSIDANKNVLQGTVIIGKLDSDGVGTNDLIVSFNSKATKAIVQQLVRSVAFRTIGAQAGANRTILFTVSDGAGGTSGQQVKTVLVT